MSLEGIYRMQMENYKSINQEVCQFSAFAFLNETVGFLLASELSSDPCTALSMFLVGISLPLSFVKLILFTRLLWGFSHKAVIPGTSLSDECVS